MVDLGPMLNIEKENGKIVEACRKRQVFLFDEINLNY